MSQHVPDDLLQAFVDGDVGEQVAVHVASHLDSCPACATRAAGLEPLAAAFAATEDPVAPEGLSESVLAVLARPERVPLLELGVGGLLLGCAALLALGLQSPVAAVADFGTSVEAIEALLRGIGASVGALQLAMVASTLLLAAGAIVTILASVRLRSPSSEGGWASARRSP